MSLWKKNVPATTNSWLALQNEMNSLFETFNRDPFMPFAQEGFMPKLEVKEDSKAYSVSAELPGMKEDDIQLTLNQNTLYIHGEKKNETKQEDNGVTRSEFSYGSFYRSVPFAAEVNPEKVSATYKDGILSVMVEKKDQTSLQNRKINIRKE